MILLDCSVLFDHTRGKDPKLAGYLTLLPIAVCGVTRTETLCGAKTPSARNGLLNLLNAFRQVPTPEAIWDLAGDHFARLRSHGVTVPMSDVILATVAIFHDLELWARDAHFALIQRWLPALRLFQEPP